MSYYQTLLRVSIEHSYNLDGICTCLSFLPTQKTESLLVNAGLLCKKTADGIQILYDKDRLEALELYVQDRQDPLSFDFKVYSNDPDFKSYTEPYAAASDSVLYFDNHSTGGAGRQNLSVSSYVSNKDFKNINLSVFSNILSSEDRLLPPEFVVRIFAGNGKEQLLKQWLEPEPTIYSIRFESRQRYWKYYLLGRLVSKNRSNDTFYVVDPDRQFEFESTGEEQLSDQSLAYTFRSKKQIPFNDFYPYRFQLKQKGRGDELVVIDQLPVASIKQIGEDKIKGRAAVVAEIYINS